MRPIDADVLKWYKCETCEQRERCEDNETVCSEIADIDEQPTIDVMPMKHGHWKFGCICSECENVNGELSTDYCPNCGARMDGDMKGV